jgi:HTH-type transcriptional regulator, bacterioopsin transcriptional activator and related proteins
MDEDRRAGEAGSLRGHEPARAILERLPGGVYALDDDAPAVVTDRVCELLGFDPAATETAAKTLRALFGNAHERAIDAQKPVTAETYHSPTGRWLETEVSPSHASVTGYLRDVTERRAGAGWSEDRSQQADPFDGVYGVMQAINEAIVTDSTREELERIACETLAEMPAYEFAFVAAVDSTTGDVIQRIEAGVEGYVESIPLSTNSDEPAGRGPAGRAIRTQELQVSNDVLADPDFEPWHDDARERGYRSAAAVPIAHDGGLYGVIGVTSATRRAFTHEVREGFSQLGNVLGHAIAALERKRALMGDELIELEYTIDHTVELSDGPDMTDQYVSFERVVQISDDQFLEYGVTAAETFPNVERLVDCISHWESVAVLNESSGEVSFELTITSPPMITVVTSHGGYVESAAIDGSHYFATIHLPESTDVRAVTEAIQKIYPSATNVARRQVTPSNESIAQIQDHLYGTLTDRQRTVLETAYYAGFFEWPRNSSGEEIAETLGITPATFHEHLRAAQQKIVAAVVNEPDTTRGT